MQGKKKLTVVLMIISMVLMTGNLWAAGITETEAMNIAKGFVKFQGEQGGFTAWAGATVSKLEKFYSSNGIIVAYEASVKSSDGQPKGYVMVNARKGAGVAPMFSLGGESVSTSLNTYYDGLIKVVEDFKKSAGLTKLTVSEHVLLASLPASFAVGIKFANMDELKAKFPDVANALAKLPEQDGWTILSDVAQSVSQNYQYDETTEDPAARGLDDCATRAAQDSLTEEDSFRQALMNQSFTGNDFQKEDSGTISSSDSKGPVTIGEVPGYFAPFYQELLGWNYGQTIYDRYGNRGCLASSGAVAWAIVLEYWDSYRYYGLIPGGDYHADCQDGDVRNMIDSLRGYLKAECTWDYQSNVRSSNMSRGKYYARDMGYSFNSSTYTSSLWTHLKTAINKQWPTIALLDSQGNEYVVVYAYAEYVGSSNDYYCAMTGWRGNQQQCFYKNTLHAVTIIQPGN